MKKTILLISLLTLSGLYTGCNRVEDIEREEEMESRELRDFDQSEPLSSDREIQYERDVLGNEEATVP